MQQRIMGLPKWISPFILSCSRLPPADPPPKKKARVEMFTESVFSKVTQKKGKETFKWHRRVQKHDSLAAKWKTVVTLCCAMALFQCVD